MEGDEDFQLTAARLKELGQKRMTLEEKKLRRRALDELGLPTFQRYLKNAELAVPRAASTILQLNIGLYCNQACSHCHVESSPQRTESMSREVADQCLAVLRASPAVSTLDITGGAPELNPQFRYLVQQACAAGVEVIDRCNLTVLQEPGQEDLAEFLAENMVNMYNISQYHNVIKQSSSA
jgi:sulfatase maturation enzyme AslB (radical SAM superfamily)